MRRMIYKNEEDRQAIINNLNGEIIKEDIIIGDKKELILINGEENILKCLKPDVSEVKKAERQIQLIDDLNELGVL